MFIVWDTMNIFKKFLESFLSLFGGKRKEKDPESLPPGPATEKGNAGSVREDAVGSSKEEKDDGNKIVETDGPFEAEVPSEPPDQPEEEVDDPAYDLEHETEDDDTEREELAAPAPSTVQKIFAEMSPLDLWRERQTWLKEVGYDPGPADGKPGRKTEAAVRAFQKDYNLEVDGMWGAKTQAAMLQALKDKDRAPPATPVAPRPPVVGPSKYDDMIGEVELDDEFWACFIDLTAKSNVLDKEGRRRRKGSRPWKNLKRICWHQTSFTWRPRRESMAEGRFSGHHQINAHACFDTDGVILLIHNFMYYLWTANAFNIDCFSFEIMGNFEGNLGSGNWYKGDTFGRARPKRIQIIRARQLTKWLMNPELGPEDDKLPKPLLEWRKAVRQLGSNPLKWNNTHRQATDDRVLDCGSECWYHIVMWGVAALPGLSVGPEKGRGKKIPVEWTERPAFEPLPKAA